ncbi:hypothetical protein DJ58_4304 [Yersinia frederiksenii ATCC 33641]|uniref:Uncharacterized protein n=1 Tax=Yersinia frederiksenii ATCC 33641 TaxID=349966 RepID=A0ABR4VW96_YERFR|nr:hypothetical protein DJ58_4304 [Yersinia frederiksenii ATCC 33641]
MIYYNPLILLLGGLLFSPLVTASKTTNTHAVKLFTRPLVSSFFWY